MTAPADRVSRIFHAALARPPEEQLPFVSQACEGDEALRQEVESLLRLDGLAARFLEWPATAALADSVDAARLASTRVGKYEIGALLGAGGMAEVYRARDIQLSRDVAIKILPSRFADDPDRLARFEREARLLASLNHPRIATIHGLERVDSHLFLVLELVEGQTLSQRLEAGPVAVEDALDLGRQIAEALEAAHARGVVHRDLKPTNVKITVDGSVKLLDFGLAKALVPASADGKGNGEISVSGLIVGTAAYMSPEQARGQAVDQRTDIWAFGCVLYEMLTGHRAFPGDTASDVLAAVLTSEPDWSAFPASAPASIRLLLRRCLEKNAARRVREIADARLEIEQTLESTFEPGNAAPSTRHARKWWQARLTRVMLLPLLGLAGYVALRAWPAPGATGAIAPLSLTTVPGVEHLRRLTFEPGYHANPSWTPDASMLVFAADRGDNVDVWLQHARGGPPLRLTDDRAADWQPAVSPDGSRIVFRSERAGGGLFVMPVLGGAARRVTAFGHWPQWSRDGTHILFVERPVRTTETPPALHVIRSSGGEPRAVAGNLGAHAPDFCCFRGAAWHPDGRRVSALSTDFGKRWIFVTYDIDTGASVVSDTSRAPGGGLESDGDLGEERLFGSLAWAPRGDAVYFLAYSEGVRSVWRVKIDPQTLQWASSPERVTAGPTSIRDFSLSLSGARIVFSTYEDSLRLWALPRSATNGQLTGSGSVIDTESEWAITPDVSADGARLVYVDARTGRREIRVRELASGTEYALFPGDEFQRSHPRWSPDGRALSYSRRLTRPAAGRPGASLMRWSEARVEEEPLTSPGSPVGVAQSWGRGSDSLLVVGFDQKTSPQRAVVALLEPSTAPAAERSVRVVASDLNYDFYAQDLSPDGHWVAYNAVPRTGRKGASSRLFIAPVVPGRAAPVTTGEYWEDKLRWADDGRFVYFVSDASGFFNIWARRFDATSGTLLGDAFRVTDFRGPAHAMPSTATASSLNIDVSRTAVIAPIVDRHGSVWSLEVPESR
jgi:Tol biopolymer transport system component